MEIKPENLIPAAINKDIVTVKAILDAHSNHDLVKMFSKLELYKSLRTEESDQAIISYPDLADLNFNELGDIKFYGLFPYNWSDKFVENVSADQFNVGNSFIKAVLNNKLGAQIKKLIDFEHGLEIIDKLGYNNMAIHYCKPEQYQQIFDKLDDVNKKILTDAKKEKKEKFKSKFLTLYPDIADDDNSYLSLYYRKKSADLTDNQSFVKKVLTLDISKDICRILTEFNMVEIAITMCGNDELFEQLYVLLSDNSRAILRKIIHEFTDVSSNMVNVYGTDIEKVKTRLGDAFDINKNKFELMKAELKDMASYL
jgi:hypothetical protein